MRKVKFSLLVGAALVGIASPAAAQWYGGTYSYNAPPPPYGYGARDYARPLSRDEIVDRLEDGGFDDVGRPRFDGSVYVVEATGRRGGAVRLVVDAYDGRILRQTSLSVARLDTPEDGFDIDGDAAPRGRSVYPPPEMPNAPRWRPGEPEGLPGRQAARPIEPEIDAQSPIRPARPADRRLAPDSPSAGTTPAEPEPRREARRPSSSDAGVSSSDLQSINPDSKRAARPAPKPKAESSRTDEAGKSAAAAADKPTQPAKPSPRVSPTAPSPSTTSKTEAKKPSPAGPTTADAGERKVRVIEGVTPMNGGQQATPAPQNNVEASSKPDQAGKN